MIPLQFYKLVAVNKHDCARVCKWCIHTLLSIKLSITYRMQPMYETVEQWEALKLYPHHYLSTWHTSVELSIMKSQKRRLEKIVLKLADQTHLSAVATEMHMLAALTPVRSKSPRHQWRQSGCTRNQNTVSVKCSATELFTQHFNIVKKEIRKSNISTFPHI